MHPAETSARHYARYIVLRDPVVGCDGHLSLTIGHSTQDGFDITVLEIAHAKGMLTLHIGFIHVCCGGLRQSQPSLLPMSEAGISFATITQIRQRCTAFTVDFYPTLLGFDPVTTDLYYFKLFNDWNQALG